jgi:hypothetical protein
MAFIVANFVIYVLKKNKIKKNIYIPTEPLTHIDMYGIIK